MQEFSVERIQKLFEGRFFGGRGKVLLLCEAMKIGVIMQHIMKNMTDMKIQ